MRLSTKIGATLSTAALGAATVLGGAGIAQAQSLGSLGSSDPAPIVLTVAGDEDAVGGTVRNNTDEPVVCVVTATTAEAAAGLEEAFVGDATIEGLIEASTEFIAAGAAGQNAVATVTVPANETEDWEGGVGYDPDADFVAGAFVQCGDQVVFAYESTGLFGSLDMGSLGS